MALTPIDSEAALAAVKEPTDARLSGQRLTHARVAWCALALALVVPFSILLPGFYGQLSTVCDGPRCALVQPASDSAHQLRAIGLTVGGYAAITMGSVLLTALICGAVAGVIVWRRSDDWMALTIALAQVAVGTTLVDYAGETRPTGPRLLALAASVLAIALVLLAGLRFPTGRFTPRWTCWVLLGWLAAGATFMGASLGGAPPPFVPQTALTLVVFAVMGWSILARYGRLTNPVQRAQVRWVVFGAGITIGLELALVGPALLAPALSRHGSLYWLAVGPLFGLPLICFAVCLGVAILRFHLYDIDILINRALVYGTLTAFLAIVYGLAVSVLQLGVTAVTGQGNPQPLVITVSTLGIAALFQPLRRRVQSAIDRRFFRRKYDAARTLETFGETLRAELNLEDLNARLLAAVEETMEPASISLWLRSKERESGQGGAVAGERDKGEVGAEAS
jgi:hypothetical protein